MMKKSNGRKESKVPHRSHRMVKKNERKIVGLVTKIGYGRGKDRWGGDDDLEEVSFSSLTKFAEAPIQIPNPYSNALPSHFPQSIKKKKKRFAFYPSSLVGDFFFFFNTKNDLSISILKK